MVNTIADDQLQFKRISVNELRYQESNNEKRWRLSHLKDQFESLKLHKLFNRYIQRISHGYFSQFLTLQIVLTTSHLIVLLATVEHRTIIPDLILYSLISLISVVLLIVTDIYVKQKSNLLKYLAGSAFVTTFFTNAFIPFYYRKHDPYGTLRPAYTTYLLISNYIFLNIHNNLVAFVLGIFISIFHLIMLILVTYENNDRLYQRVGSDSIYLICVNCLGIYFRYMNEIIIRRSFLDRRSCVESTHQLKFEQEQENNLMSSIIPQHIISRARSTLLHHIENDGDFTRRPFEDLYVEEHPDVSILFADIVNYTTMTTHYSNVVELLDILNELFGRFDDASEALKVLRIKFLGDCYYCVAGLPPNPVPNHAEACVDLGLKMISIIQDIRRRKDLNINMRIGIHSGKISCGIIGTIKWQYDIWSTDVDIANKMETEGEAGMVHITTETKNLLRKPYNIRPTNKVINGYSTYLIKPFELKPNSINGGVNSVKSSIESVIASTSQNDGNQDLKTAMKDLRTSLPTTHNVAFHSLSDDIIIENERKRDFEPLKRHTVPNTRERRTSGGIFQKVLSDNGRFSANRRITGDTKRRTAFMNNNIKRYNESLLQTNKELETTIEDMSLSKFEQWFKKSDMYRIILVFKDLRQELEFFQMPDPLFKYYLVCEVILLILVFILESLTSKWEWPLWPFYLTVGLIIFIFIPLTWTHYIWTKYLAKFQHDLPTNRIVLFLYKTSKYITNNSIIRVLMYTFLYFLFWICVMMEWIDCYEEQIYETEQSVNQSAVAIKRNFLLLITGHLYNNTSNEYEHCVIPWHMTETFAIAIMMSFLFLRMYMWLKLIYAVVTASVYTFCILNYTAGFFKDSHTFNYGLLPQTAHIIGIFFLTATLHFVDRQTEYINRIDHSWYKDLVEKEEQANRQHTVNNLLLKNILPIRIANIYLNLNRHSSEEIFHEYYQNAAVMFASITNFSTEEMGSGFLKHMNEIIKEFDVLLLGTSYGRPIEKIKIAKWTYMAACGLVPGVGDSENIRRDQSDHVVISLLKFAVDLIQALNSLNRQNQQNMKLRIGISHGFIAAGVVGSKKPHYDIWGDPVNMASRMDTTGLVDNIQVLEETAEVIRSFGYTVRHRGQIRVKGRENLVSTYFVELDNNFQLVKT